MRTLTSSKNTIIIIDESVRPIGNIGRTLSESGIHRGLSIAELGIRFNVAEFFFLSQTRKNISRSDLQV